MNNLEDFKYIKGFGGKGGGGQAAQPTAAYEDVEGFVYGGQNYNVYQFAKVKDLLSEGPIEGLIEGQYAYKGRVGDLGFTGVYYNEYPLVVGENTESKFLKSIQWNGNPLIDTQDKYNFQQIDVNVTKGQPAGTALGGEFDNVSYIRSIGERLRGPNQLALTEDEVSDYQRTYRIINKECRKISLSFRVSSLYVTLKYQDGEAIMNNALTIDGVAGVDTSDKTFILSQNDRQAENSQSKIKAGVGSVIYNKFKIRIKATPIYKEAANFNPAKIDIVSSIPRVINDDKNLVVVQQENQQLPLFIEVECKGKVTQGYVKQIVLDMSTSFAALNQNENWLGWDVSIIKVTPEDTFSSRSSFLSLESITEIYSSSFRYPNSAIVTSRFNAAYFSKIPERTYDVKLLKVNVPKNYNPLTKTYGDTNPLTIDETILYSQTIKPEIIDYYIGENESYANTSDINPPVTLNLIGQFDAGNTTNTGANTNVTAWANRIVGTNITCTLSASQPKYGKPGEESPNGSYGVSFASTQTANFLNGTKFFSDANGNCTIFVVSKWDASSTASTRGRILQGYYNNNWILGNYAKYNKAFLFGSWVYGLMGDNNGNFNSSNYWNSSNDSNTYIAGAVIKDTQDVNIFWQNSIYSIKPKVKSTAPQGLSINAREPSDCTVFEILIYDRALSKTEAIKVRNWLNNKWNVKRSSLSYSSVIKYLNEKSLVVGSSTYLTMPLKTICANGQRSKGYNVEGQAAGSYQFDLIPQRFWDGSNSDRKFYLREQGFCSFYCDFFLKLKSDIADGTYSLIHRDNQFNLSIKILGAQASLLLTIISPTKNYTVTKLLDTTEHSPTVLKNNFRRFSIYILPKIVKPTINYKPGAAEVFRNGIDQMSLYNAAKQYGFYNGKLNDPVSAISSISFREDDTYSDISNLQQTCTKSVAISFFQTSPIINSPGGFDRIPASDFFPDILNAEIDVLLDFKTQIKCNLNISDYESYQTLCVGHDIRPMVLAPNVQTVVAGNAIGIFNPLINYYRYLSLFVYNTIGLNQSLDSYNRKNIDVVFDSNNVTLSSTQSNVLLPIKQDQIYTFGTAPAYSDGLKSGPFIPASFINNNSKIEIFTDKSSVSFGGKIQGNADSIRVNQIEFDRSSLSKAYAKTLFSEGLPKKQIIYAPQGVASYETSSDYWDGDFKTNKEWTDNPAWCFFDLLTNKRYGAGNYVSETDVDKWSLYQIGKYCDQLVSDGFGGVESRFSCNLYIQSQEDALKVLSDMASIFRGMFYYSNGFIYAINDMPENTPIYSFTNANVVDGNFNYESTSLKDRNSAVYIRYIDKNNLYKPAVEYIENIEAIRKFGFRETELTAFGCTSRGQAQRLGRWLLASEYNETETVSFEAGPECVYLKPGDVVKIYDYNRKYKTVGGRLNYINISGDTNLTTGILTLDRKLDFNFSGNQNYKFTIISPKYNLDPSFDGAVNSNNDYNEYRKPLTNSFIINSGNLITGQYYDSIRITGSAPVMASGLNITGLSYFTGASGMSPKSIPWVLENSGNLNGATDSDYDLYRVFRIQESTEGANYTVLASQMYNLKYTQIESGLNITPAKAPAGEASAPSKGIFTKLANNSIDLSISYDSSIRTSTIGFKVFIKENYDSSFNPNTDGSFTFVSINLYDSIVKINIPLKNGGTVRIYGTNINNESTLSYILGQDSTNTNNSSVSPNLVITYNDVNKNSSISLPNNQTYGFISPVTQTRTNYFKSASPNNLASITLPDSLSININLDFITNPSKFPDSSFPYRIKIIPEKVETKQAFITSLSKYQNSSSPNDYIFEDKIYDSRGFYSYKTSNTLARYRSFSIAIDKASASTDTVSSTSNDFVNPDGFLLLTYDNQETELVSSLDTIFTNSINSFSIISQEGENYLNLTINQSSADSFIDQYYLLLVPIEQTFVFGVNDIIYTDEGVPFGIEDPSGDQIIDSHFITIPNNQNIFSFNSNKDSNGKSFASTIYKAYLIAQDSFMSAWKAYATFGTTRQILDYYSSFIDKNGMIGKIYPQISKAIEIKKAADPTVISSLETILKNSGSKYIHFSANKTIMIENIFDTSVATTSVFPNYTISRRSVIYKPTLDINLTTTQDNRVLSTDPNKSMAYYKLSLQNRDNISSSPISPTIPQSARAYALNGNKIFTRALIENADVAASPKLIQGVNSEGNTPNIYKLRSTITNSSFGKDGQEIFDISIIRLSDLSGELKSKITDYPNSNSVLVKSENSNTEANSNKIFDTLITNGLFNSNFNVINLTPENNWNELGLNPKNIVCNIGNAPKQFTVYSLNGDTISSQFQLPAINSLFYAGVPVLESDGISISLQTTDNITQTRPIKVYCFNGEDLIQSSVNQTTINKGNYNEIRVTITDLKFKNYYTYANSYNAGTSITNSNFWAFKDPKNLAFAHLSAKNALGSIPKYNFHIQTLELSVVITY
jgi:hypothetical protein